MADEDLLQSWKEIAAHLGRSERTCRRWEIEFRLPVHRLDGSPRGSVFAYRSELDKWMSDLLHKEKGPPSIESRPQSKKYLTIIVALAAIVAVAVAVVLLRIGRSESQSPPPSDNPTLAILPFTNNTGDESLDFWGNALADLLVSDLSQSRYLTVLPQDRVFSVLRDLDLLDAGAGDAIDLEQVASRAQVDNVVVGSFIKAGQRFRISATALHIPTGHSVVLPSVEARNQEEIFLRVDDLSTEIKNHLVSAVDRKGRDIDLDTRSITTSSIEAYKYYIDGRLSLRNDRAAEAVESLEMAVAIDPEFAMAYSTLATCYRSLPGHGHEAEEALSRSFALSQHASLRERLYIQAYYYRTRGPRGVGQYLETCQEFVRVYPDDVRAVFFLGEIYLWLEEWERSVETYESIGSSHPNLSQAYRALGQYEEALEVAERAGPNVDSLEYRHQVALNEIYKKRFELALLEADKMLERSPGYAPALMVKGDVNLYRAEWDQAEEYYGALLHAEGSEYERQRSRILGFDKLANLYFARGQFERAVDLLDQAIGEVTALGEERWLLSLRSSKAYILLEQGDLSAADAEIEIALDEANRRDHVGAKLGILADRGMIDLQMGDVRGAKRAADEMKMEIEGWLNSKLIRQWHWLAGEIQLAEEDLGDAVAHFESAIALLPHQYVPNGDPHALYYSSLAYAYYLSGDIGKAQEWYENVLALTSGRLIHGTRYVKSHFMLGKIYQRRGMNAEAIRSYRTFLDLWREADSTTPEIEEAKRSLAELLG